MNKYVDYKFTDQLKRELNIKLAILPNTKSLFTQLQTIHLLFNVLDKLYFCFNCFNMCTFVVNIFFFLFVFVVFFNYKSCVGLNNFLKCCMCFFVCL